MSDECFIFRRDFPVDGFESGIVRHHVPSIRGLYFHPDVLPDFHRDGALSELPTNLLDGLLGEIFLLVAKRIKGDA